MIMKKQMKAAILAGAVATLLIWIVAVWMLRAVSGDSLFYMNSILGKICAVSYRWVSLVSLLLFVFWSIFAVKSAGKISQERQRNKAKKTAVKSETKETTNNTAAKKSVSAAKADTATSVNTTGTAKTNTAVSENTPGMSEEGTAVAANAHSAAVKPVVTDKAETAETGKITATVPADTKSASEQIVSHSNEKKPRGSKGRVCKSCGTPVSDKSRFCPSCGNKITAD